MVYNGVATKPQPRTTMPVLLNKFYNYKDFSQQDYLEQVIRTKAQNLKTIN
jgi:hypothetical protein